MELKVQSGAKVVINEADFADVMALKNAIGEVLGGTGLKLDVKSLKLSSDLDVGQILSAAFKVDCNPIVNAKLMKCLERCTYNDHKITADTFEPSEARGDYYEIIAACLSENLTPFLKPLVSKLFAILIAVSLKAENQTSK